MLRIFSNLFKILLNFSPLPFGGLLLIFKMLLHFLFHLLRFGALVHICGRWGVLVESLS